MIPVSYNLRNLRVQWKTTLLTSGGFTLLVATLLVVWAFVDGLDRSCANSGEAVNVLVLRKGAYDEIFSYLDAAEAAQIQSVSGIARTSDGQPLVSRELCMALVQPDEARKLNRLWQLRGVLPQAMHVHSHVRVFSGRMLGAAPGEIIVGRLLGEVERLTLGSRLRLGHKEWTVVGLFEADGAVFESEIWCDLDELAGHFRRKGRCTSLVARTSSATSAIDLAHRLNSSRAVPAQAQIETAYYEKHVRQLQKIRSIGLLIASFMAVGAICGLLNTMMAAIHQRRRDLAVLRILGFPRIAIVASFLLESLLLGALGVVLGTMLGYLTSGITGNLAVGVQAIHFALRVEPAAVLVIAILTLGLSLLAGMLPALFAMHSAVLPK